LSTVRHHAGDRHARFLADFLGQFRHRVPDLSAYATKMRVPVLRAWTDDNLLRQVVYEGLREDKPAAEVRREVPHEKR
jgi:hypothetical protein